MKLVLKQLRGEEELSEHEFTQEVVRVGRDLSRCDLPFDATEWPTISRVHAELRWQNGRLILFDNGSSNGTFLDGQRVRGSAPLYPGARVRLGPAGPALLVVRCDPGAAAEKRAGTTRNLGASGEAAPPTRPAPQKPEPAPLSRPTAIVTAPPRLIFEGGATTEPRQHFIIDAETIMLGRDPGADVRIESSAAFVSRRHAEIRRQPDGSHVLSDLKSFNGTLLNGQRISRPMPLFHGDVIHLGVGGPRLRFVQSSPDARTAERSAETPTVPVTEDGADPGAPPTRPTPSADPEGPGTLYLRPANRALTQSVPSPFGAGGQLLAEVAFGDRQRLTVGRAPDNDVRLDVLQISKHHARFVRTPEGVFVEDAGSTNGVFVNGSRIGGRRAVQAEDVVQIGPFILHAGPERGVAVFDARSKTRIEAVDINLLVPGRRGDVTKILDDIDISISPNEFVGLLGPSGAGKSVLMNALNGMSPPTSGRVLINSLELYKHLDSLKQSIGYVPQDDIIHRELTVYRTLYYVARLRLSRDVGEQEIDQIINQVLDVTGLVERRDLPVARLSGGQRKRVSIAVELITKPSAIFLDEPTSGLDPAAEAKVMKLFRQIAESGRTVVLTTHAMENVGLFDKVALLMRGRLIFYGTPRELLAFVGAERYSEVYEKLEAEALRQTADLASFPPGAGDYEARRNAARDQAADHWRTLFRETDIFQRNIAAPLEGVERGVGAAPVARRRSHPAEARRQLGTLARRYADVFLRDRLNLVTLLVQAPVIALLTVLVVRPTAPRDFPFFVLALVAVWFGASVSAREIVKERAVYRRERHFNLRLLPYVGSKFLVLSLIVCAQCVLLFGTLKLFDLAGLSPLPGRYGGALQLLVMILTGMVGVALGLFISALVKTSEMATSLVPLILIPQILFSGLAGVPNRVTRVVGAAMPSTWAFDEIKRLSALDTLYEEGSAPGGPNGGRGLYRHVEEANDRNIAKARSEMVDYRAQAEANLREYETKMKTYMESLKSGRGAASAPAPPTLAPPPSVSEAEKLSDDLSGYVSFMHPWGDVVINPLVLLAMLFLLFSASVLALRARDAGGR